MATYILVLQLWQELNQIQDASILEVKVTEYNQKVAELWDNLMGYEMQLVDQLDVRTFFSYTYSFWASNFWDTFYINLQYPLVLWNHYNLFILIVRYLCEPVNFDLVWLPDIFKTDYIYRNLQ